MDSMTHVSFINDFEPFKVDGDVIVANRMSKELEAVRENFIFEMCLVGIDVLY